VPGTPFVIGMTTRSPRGSPAEDTAYSVPLFATERPADGMSVGRGSDHPSLVRSAVHTCVHGLQAFDSSRAGRIREK